MIRKSILAAAILTSTWAFAGGKEYEIKGMSTDEHIKSLKAKVCGITDIESCDIKLGKITLMAKGKAKLDDESVKKAVKGAGSFEVLSSKEVGNGRVMGN